MGPTSLFKYDECTLKSSTIASAINYIIIHAMYYEIDHTCAHVMNNPSASFGAPAIYTIVYMRIPFLFSFFIRFISAESKTC